MIQMRSSASRPRRLMTELNLVPYIDVMLVLLVIFMITAPLLSQGVHVNLPKAQASTIQAANKSIILTVDAQNHYYLNTAQNPNRSLDSAQLVSQLALDLHDASDRCVFIKGDKTVSYGSMITAMTLLQQAGVAKIYLLAAAPDKKIS